MIIDEFLLLRLLTVSCSQRSKSFLAFETTLVELVTLISKPVSLCLSVDNFLVHSQLVVVFVRRVLHAPVIEEDIVHFSAELVKEGFLVRSYLLRDFST